VNKEEGIECFGASHYTGIGFKQQDDSVKVYAVSIP
jgi:hypothetical protein